MELVADHYYLTQKGNEILRKALGGTQIVFSAIQTGDGELPTDSEAATQLTGLVSSKQTFPVSAISINNGRAKISAVIANDTLEAGYYIREAGLFCISQDTGEEVLFAIARVNGNWVPPKAPGSIFNYLLSIYIVIGEASNVTIKVGSDLYQLKEDALTIDQVYPVGSIFITLGENIDPNKLWVGTTWEKMAEGSVLLSAGDNYKSGQNYGANDKPIDKSNLPAVNVGIKTNESGYHQHKASDFLNEIGFDVTNGGGGDPEMTRMAYGDNHPWNNYKRLALTGFSGSHSHTGQTKPLGDGKRFNVMQSSIAAYFWVRKA